jgi:hypothetical protein
VSATSDQPIRRMKPPTKSPSSYSDDRKEPSTGSKLHVKEDLVDPP